MKLYYYDCKSCGLHHIYQPEKCDYCHKTEFQYVEIDTEDANP
jgi:hypothetical protein